MPQTVIPSESNPLYSSPHSQPIFPGFDRAFDNQKLLHYFQQTWEAYEWLFTSISEDQSYYAAPDPLRHPLIFYYGHTAVFYLNKMVVSGLIPETDRINPRFEVLFAKGVDPDIPEHLQKDIDWPTLGEVRDYRRRAFDFVSRFLKEHKVPAVISPESPWWAIFMALEHDRIHFETSSVLIRQYPAEWLSTPMGWQTAPADISAAAAKWIHVPAQTIKLGKPDQFPTFGWDNEYGMETRDVAGFTARNTLVTNEEFAAFVNSGGFNQERFWSKEGWSWKQEFRHQQPKWWRKAGAKWEYRTMFEWIPLPGSWPAEVNYHEAEAYINWLDDGSRFLSEAEFHCIAKGTPGNTPGDDVLYHPECYNVNIRWGSPSAVGSHQEGRSALGFEDVWGNVWEWLSDYWAPLNGFKPHPYYLDFSDPYFDDEHNMMLGGSWATSGTGASRFYRLWFRRHFYQHCGFRLAKDQ